MNIRTALGWLAFVTLLVATAAALAQAQAPVSAAPAVVDELWTMVKAAGILGSFVLLLALRGKQKDLDAAIARVNLLTERNEALHIRYLEDTAKTREIVQEQTVSTATLVRSIADAMAVGVRERREAAERYDRDRG